MNPSIDEKLNELMECMIEIKTEVKTLTSRGCLPGEMRVEKLKEHIEKEMIDHRKELDIKIDKTTKHIKIVGALGYVIGAIATFFGLKIPVK